MLTVREALMAVPEHVVAVPIQRPHRWAYFWELMLTLDKKGEPFSVIEIVNLGNLTQIERQSLSRYVTRLVRGGYLVKIGQKQVRGFCRATLFYKIGKFEVSAPQVQRTGEPHAITSALTMIIPRNEDGAWVVIKSLAKSNREFTAEQVHEAMQGALPLESIADYIRRLGKGKFAELNGVVMQNGRLTKAWRLLRAPAETPRLGVDGRPLKHAAQQDAMWKALEMGGLLFITANDLAMYATTPELEVPESVAAEYADHLTASGHLAKRDQTGKQTIYRLMRHTGPMAPRIYRASFVWDPNLNCVFGPGQTVREVRR